ncbi:hypothetical protein ACLOJK_036360, partial [Asimina triloba]
MVSTDPITSHARFRPTLSKTHRSEAASHQQTIQRLQQPGPTAIKDGPRPVI